LTNLEIWVSLASLGLIIMFVVLMTSFYLFLIRSGPQGPDIPVQPPGVIVQVVSISGAPGVILCGITYGLAKNYGSKEAGLILFVAGVILSTGMLYFGTLVLQTPETYAVPFLEILQYAFVAAGVGIMAIGVLLIKKPTRNHGSLVDENF
jgi:hypothetical protein